MKRLSRVLEVVFLLLVIAIYCKPAKAYVDMGTGSYILQLSIAAAAGALFSMKLFWKTLRDRVRAFFARRHETASSTATHAR